MVGARVNAQSAGDAVAQIDAARDVGATAIEISTVESVHPLGGVLATESLAGVVAAAEWAKQIRVDASVGVFAAHAWAHPALVLARDPVAALATGAGSEGDLAALADLPSAATVTSDGRSWHAGGASDEQELSAVIATVVHFLRTGRDKVSATVVADTDQFATIAKFRAARMLLARIAELAKAPLDIRIHAETAWRSMSAREPHVNILRATSAAFGAAVGGADSITVLPFDALAGGDAPARRLAVNTQTILAEEAHLYRVADPAAGSGAIEAATAALAAAAWARFQNIESEGGIITAIKRGALLNDIAKTREARLADATAGAIKMIGVNAYASEASVTTQPRDESNRLVYRRLPAVVE
ncbi:MAG TPA: methylmalonyl-CoA mutase family protein [Bauldia sp.]|nr:methylmalonyl-CoA mutase family protein [Bauldia sp.]